MRWQLQTVQIRRCSIIGQAVANALWAHQSMGAILTRDSVLFQVSTVSGVTEGGQFPQHITTLIVRTSIPLYLRRRGTIPPQAVMTSRWSIFTCYKQLLSMYRVDVIPVGYFSIVRPFSAGPAEYSRVCPVRSWNYIRPKIRHRTTIDF